MFKHSIAQAARKQRLDPTEKFTDEEIINMLRREAAEMNDTYERDGALGLLYATQNRKAEPDQRFLRRMLGTTVRSNRRAEGRMHMERDGPLIDQYYRYQQKRERSREYSSSDSDNEESRHRKESKTNKNKRPMEESKREYSDNENGHLTKEKGSDPYSHKSKGNTNTKHESNGKLTTESKPHLEDKDVPAAKKQIVIKKGRGIGESSDGRFSRTSVWNLSDIESSGEDESTEKKFEYMRDEIERRNENLKRKEEKKKSKKEKKKKKKKKKRKEKGEKTESSHKKRKKDIENE